MIPTAGLPLGLLDIGPIELLILAAAAVMLFGGNLPEMARRAGHVVGRLRASAQELTRDMEPPPGLDQLPTPGPREDAPAEAPADDEPLASDEPPAPGPKGPSSEGPGPSGDGRPPERSGGDPGGAP